MRHRRIPKFLCLPVVLFALAQCCVAASSKTAAHYIVYVGTYTGAQSKGIYAYNYDAASGKLSPIRLAAETASPSFLVVSRDSKFVYAVNETHDYQGESSGGVSAFKIAGDKAKLDFLNAVSSSGADPCYITVDRSGKYLLVANYNGGDVAAFPISSDGRVGKASSVMEDKGALGPNHEHQEKAHAHWIETSARNRLPTLPIWVSIAY